MYVNDFPFIYRDKSKRCAEQATAVVCLKVLDIDYSDCFRELVTLANISKPQKLNKAQKLNKTQKSGRLKDVAQNLVTKDDAPIETLVHEGNGENGDGKHN